MANPLKDLYRDMDADPGEMDRYRAGLAGRLEQRARSPWLPLALIPLAAALLVFWLRPTQVPLATALALLDSPEQIEELMAVRQPTREEYLPLVGVDSLVGLDAGVLLILDGPKQQAMETAATAVRVDPRADFRTFYLEFLIEEGEDYSFNPSLIEELMDRESDRVNRKLLARLLQLALIYHDHLG